MTLPNSSLSGGGEPGNGRVTVAPSAAFWLHWQGNVFCFYHSEPLQRASETVATGRSLGAALSLRLMVTTGWEYTFSVSLPWLSMGG